MKLIPEEELSELLRIKKRSELIEEDAIENYLYLNNIEYELDDIDLFEDILFEILNNWENNELPGLLYTYDDYEINS